MKRFTLILLLCVFGCDALIPPQPTPNPPPIVDPQPVTKATWFFVVEESADRTPELAALLADPFWQTVQFRLFDDDTPEAADIVKALGSTKLPALLLIDAAGKVTFKGELPKTVDEVKKLAGAK